jgi:Subtilase family
MVMPSGDAQSKFEQELQRAKKGAQRRAERAEIKNKPHKRGAGTFKERRRDGQEVAEYLYVEKELLVDDSYLDMARQVLAAHGFAIVRVRGSRVTGLSLIELDQDAAAVMDACVAELDRSRISLNHVLDTSGWGAFCPATEPLPPPPGATPIPPAQASPNGGRRPRVAVIDTGLLGQEDTDAHAWLTGVTGEADDDAYLSPPSDPPPKWIAPYGGHGTFVAGVVRCVAGTNCVVEVNDALVGGVVDEVTIAAELRDIISRKPDVVSISAGLYTRDNLPPLAFTSLFSSLTQQQKDEIAFVAAAGNDKTAEPFWPAAFETSRGHPVDVLAVGALDNADNIAVFSNRAEWVDLYAPGVDHVNAFCNGSYRDLSGNDHVFSGLAQWSGTSFATPLVSGLIARTMIEKPDVSGPVAAAQVIDSAQTGFPPGEGPRIPHWWPSRSSADRDR